MIEILTTIGLICGSFTSIYFAWNERKARIEVEAEMEQTREELKKMLDEMENAKWLA